MKPTYANFLSQAWAINAPALRDIHSILAGIDYDLDFMSSDQPNISRTIGNTRIIDVRGVMLRDLDPISALFGGVSTEQVKAEIASAIADHSIDQIVLNINSCGGTVDGSFALADYVYESRSSKPIIAYTDGVALSAAYLLASQCSKIVISDSAELGSIGVITSRVDLSKYYESMGVNIAIIKAGKYKDAYYDASALTDDNKSFIQGNINTYYDLLIDKVSRGRGLDAEYVATTLADARLFVGREALANKSADAIGTIDKAIKIFRGEDQMNIEQMKQYMLGNTEGLTPEQIATAEGIVKLMKNEETTEPVAPVAEVQEEPEVEQAPVVDAQALANERAAKIVRACQGLEMPELAAELILSDKSVEVCLSEIIAKVAQGEPRIKLAQSYETINPKAQEDSVSKSMQLKEKAKEYKAQHNCTLAEATSAVARGAK
jgi:signal peptide peptidase SppA